VPKQEKWMAAVRDRIDAPVLVGVGAAFDFHAGLVPRRRRGCSPPAWSGRTGWVASRGRLWRRYLRYNPRFVSGFARQWLGTARPRG
jgi:N-acetylglucosaminyldiphosphoundecaprenol N-acetyl-beta-D-mannosaminyltransferase